MAPERRQHILSNIRAQCRCATAPSLHQRDLLLQRLDVPFVHGDGLPELADARAVLLGVGPLFGQRRRRAVGIGRARFDEQLLLGCELFARAPSCACRRAPSAFRRRRAGSPAGVGVLRVARCSRGPRGAACRCRRGCRRSASSLSPAPRSSNGCCPRDPRTCRCRRAPERRRPPARRRTRLRRYAGGCRATARRARAPDVQVGWTGWAYPREFSENTV